MRHNTTVRRRLRIVLRASPEVHHAMSRVLAEAGIDCVVEGAVPDAMIVDIREGKFQRGHIGATIRTARRDAYGLPLIFLGDAGQLADKPVSDLVELDHFVPFTDGHRPLIRAIQRSVADMVRAQELGIRMTAMASLGMAATSAPVPAGADMTALLCEPGPVALPVLSGLTCLLSVNAAMKASQALHALELGKASSLVILAATNRRSQAALVKLLRRHSDLSQTPVIVLETAPGRRHVNYWATVGADIVLQAEHLVTAARSIERLTRVRRASAALDASLKATALTDRGEPSRLASGRYFEACLAERLQRQLHGGALIAVRLDAATGDGHVAALSEAAIYLAMTARSADLFTRVAPDVFLLSVPACDKVSAQSVASAMCGMIRDLRFGPHDSSCTFLPHANSVMLGPGASAQNAIAGVLRGLPARDTGVLEPA